MSFPVEFPVVSVYRGDSLSLPFTISDEGVPRDLTGWSGWVCQFRPYADSAEFIDLLVDVSALDVGLVTVSVSAAQTVEMGRSGVVDLQSSDGVVVRTWVKFVTDYVKDVTKVD
jgi:hypothetical protein